VHYYSIVAYCRAIVILYSILASSIQPALYLKYSLTMHALFPECSLISIYITGDMNVK